MLIIYLPGEIFGEDVRAIFYWRGCDGLFSFVGGNAEVFLKCLIETFIGLYIIYKRLSQFRNTVIEYFHIWVDIISSMD